MDYVKKFLNVEGVIGQGAFGRVLSTSYAPNSRVALKCIHPILRPSKLANELRHLRDLGGQNNVVQLHTAYLDKGSLYIVMELIEHDRFTEVVPQLDHGEIVLYMKNLLIALKHVHSHKIIHRDIKPANFLFNRREKKFLLVDFGLAQNVNIKYNHKLQFPNDQSTSSQSPRSVTSANSFPTTPTRFHQLQTPTTITARRLMPPVLHDPITRQHNAAMAQPTVNMSTHRVYKSPNRHSINLATLGSPITPNSAAKRQFPDVHKQSDHFNHDFKKLRLTPMLDSKEPVRLTVGAYESPVTNNTDGSSTNLFAPARRLSGNFPNSDNSQRNKQLPHKFSTPTIPSRRPPPTRRCGCLGKARSCSICISRPDNSAPKSGTPGYKAPEILIRSTNQSTAIDIWSAGVILASLLSGHTPFFRDVDDITSLSDVITLLGSTRITQAAKQLGVRITVHPKIEPVMDLQLLCLNIRLKSSHALQIGDQIPDEAFDLLKRMLDPSPLTRITASEALSHEWLSSN